MSLKYIPRNRFKSLLPHGYHVVRELRVERIFMEDVKEVFHDTIEVTTHSSATPWREFHVHSITVLLRSGECKTYPPEIFTLAVNGCEGCFGEFFEVAENGVHNRPLTYFCHCLEVARRQRAEAIESFLDWY